MLSKIIPAVSTNCTQASVSTYGFKHMSTNAKMRHVGSKYCRADRVLTIRSHLYNKFYSAVRWIIFS